MFLRAYFIVTVFAAMCQTASAQITLGQPRFTSGGTIVQPGNVYGKATFAISAAGQQDVATVLSGLMKSLIQSEYNNNDGSYLLTLELTQNNKSIGMVPIVSIEFHNRSFLFFNISKTINQGVTYEGTIVETGPIDNTNNEVTVSLKSYYSANSSFDLSLINRLLQYNKQYKILSMLDSSGVVTGVVSVFDDILGKALQKATKNTQLFTFGMGFARVAGTSPIRLVQVPLSFTNNTGETGSIAISIKTWSESSKFEFDADNGKFLAPSSSVMFENTGIPVSNGSIDIIQYLQKSGDDSTKDFLKAFLSSAGYTGQNITGECRNLLSQYRRFLSNRDVMALLLATMSEYHENFKTAKGSGCLSDRRGDFDKLGLPTAQLESELK